MIRRKLTNRGSRKLFKATALKTHKQNIKPANSWRGGERM